MKIAVVGAGLVGAVAALAMAKTGGQVIWVGPSKPESPDRFLAINPTAIAFLAELDVLSSLPKSARGPVKKMHIADFNQDTKLVFDAAKTQGYALCEIVPAAILLQTLERASRKQENIQCVPDEYVSHRIENERCMIQLKNTQAIEVDYVIVADGAMSRVREIENIPFKSHDYQRAAVTATLQLAMPHEQVAYQYFLDHGPLALLPLAEADKVSIVWSTTLTEANHLKNISSEGFVTRLANLLPQHFQDAISCSPRYTFPLRSLTAKTTVQNKVFLVGDAAHVVHPLAGLGLNLGLLDVIAVQQLFLSRQNKNRPFNPNALQRFARERQWEMGIYLKTIDAIERAFHEPKGAARKIGQLALAMGGVPFVNRLLINKATAVT